MAVHWGRSNPQTTTSVKARDSPSPSSHKLKVDFRKMKDAMKFEGQSGWGHQPGVETGGSELVWSIYVVSVYGEHSFKEQNCYFLTKNMV